MCLLKGSSQQSTQNLRLRPYSGKLAPYIEGLGVYKFLMKTDCTALWRLFGELLSSIFGIAFKRDQIKLDDQKSNKQ